ncbi:beta-galactosidase trimerization domain-containing protein [Arthrobacter sp. ATA002]|uniref:beta-galactosidase trimerization domain-containing protein n=1 Tax=Arthrobacter sp. ATA002 TaxID=2991715 RepID=UPI0022A6622C|nr:beta-galactosidase trimerization domain-containing protein [Arthrobacter sp. ATA002]WAP51511.1 beta-galactosidase trimerization domain-containing protein [Arthrobacter sp. ATA002]
MWRRLTRCPPTSSTASHSTGAGSGSTVEARSVFEILVAEEAEVIGTYGDDFYAGRAAVTRKPYPAGGEAWYVGTLLDQDGISSILRSVLAGHGLMGPYADEPELEFAVRAHGEVRTAFLLNHADTPVTVPVHAPGTDLLTGRVLTAGEPLTLAPKDVVVLREA